MSNMRVSPMLMVVDTVMTASKAMVTARYITMTHYTANRCGHLSGVFESRNESGQLRRFSMGFSCLSEPQCPNN